jgi:NAD(P)-dependent dehydrogenase (short-subunit alcohol dehydrogenase family)
VAITASIAGGQWATHLAEIQELLAVEGWDDSLAWIDAHPDLFADAYSVSKEFMQVYTMMSARAAQQHGMRINSVCPSPIDTPLLPDFRETMSEKTIDWAIEQSGRVAQPRDIALVLAFLGSDASGFVNGVNLNVDLGFSAGMAMGQLDFGALMA